MGRARASIRNFRIGDRALVTDRTSLEDGVVGTIVGWVGGGRDNVQWAVLESDIDGVCRAFHPKDLAPASKSFFKKIIVRFDGDGRIGRHFGANFDVHVGQRVLCPPPLPISNIWREALRGCRRRGHRVRRGEGAMSSTQKGRMMSSTSTQYLNPDPAAQDEIREVLQTNRRADRAERAEWIVAFVSIAISTAVAAALTLLAVFGRIEDANSTPAILLLVPIAIGAVPIAMLNRIAERRTDLPARVAASQDVLDRYAVPAGATAEQVWRAVELEREARAIERSVPDKLCIPDSERERIDAATAKVEQLRAAATKVLSTPATAA